MDNVAAPTGVPTLEIVSTVEISGVPEPSGLALDVDGSNFWTVSDQTGDIYKINRSGLVIKTIEFNGEDLEGIAVSPLDGSLYVVEERAGEVIHLDSQGSVLDRWTPAGLPSMGNSGLEGITIDPNTGNLFLLKEKNPGLLVKMNNNGAVLGVFELSFAGDYSGLAFDAQKNQLLILSDQSETLAWCDLEGNALEIMNTTLEKGEGVAIDALTRRIFAISDSRSTLTSFNLPSP